MKSDDLALACIYRGMSPESRDALRHILIGDMAHRNSVAERLMRFRLASADGLADLIDLLTINDDERRRVVRVLSEVQALEG